MATEISQRDLRNNSGHVMRALATGETFIVTSNGEPVGELIPMRRRRYVPAQAVVDAFRNAPAIDAARFRADLDQIADQDAGPRA